MIVEKQNLFDTQGSYRLAFMGALLFYLLIQLKLSPDFFSRAHLPDIDDEMRLVMVRDLLNGQAWHDTVEHRALPPDGLPMHWSRLIDAPLAGLAWLFGLATDQMAALHWAAAIWPVFLFVLFLSVIGSVMTAVFGYAQASFAVMGAAALPSISSTFFPIGRVDHHNVQILLVALALALVLRSERPERRGFFAGMTAALSLAVGLETIAFFLLLALALTGLYIAGRHGAAEKLGAYGVGIGLSAPVFFLIQTSPQDWAVARCDQLSPPLLLLTASTAVFTTSCALLRKRLRTPASRLRLAIILGSVFLVALWPLLAPCSEGSFSTLPREISEQIRNGISESLSVQRMLEIDPASAIQVVLPYLVMIVALTALLRSSVSDGHRAAISIILAFVVLAGVGLAYQIRTILWGHAAMPMAFGLVMAWTLDEQWKVSRIAKPVLASAVFVLVLFPSLPVTLVSAAVSKDGREGAHYGPGDRSCTDPLVMAQLNTLPSSRILAPLDFGTKLLLYTHHDVFALPYHRRPDAYLNGLAFWGDEIGLAERMKKSGAEYLLVCAGRVYGSDESIGSRLARGESVDWLQAPAILGDLRLYKGTFK